MLTTIMLPINGVGKGKSLEAGATLLLEPPGLLYPKTSPYTRMHISRAQPVPSTADSDTTTSLASAALGGSVLMVTHTVSVESLSATLDELGTENVATEDRGIQY